MRETKIYSDDLKHVIVRVEESNYSWDVTDIADDGDVVIQSQFCGLSGFKTDHRNAFYETRRVGSWNGFVDRRLFDKILIRV